MVVNTRLSVLLRFHDGMDKSTCGHDNGKEPEAVFLSTSHAYSVLSVNHDLGGQLYTVDDVSCGVQAGRTVDFDVLFVTPRQGECVQCFEVSEVNAVHVNRPSKREVNG